MSAHTTYYQVPPYTQHVPIPQGWRPPFQGPPPIPSGLNINPQLWQAGKWQPNPAYFAQHQGRPPQHHQQSWAASQAWQQPRAQESKNPYKRVPKPPSAEYLATRLSDNPLGLTDMIPAEEFYAQQQANETAHAMDSRRAGDPITAAESPWIWNPPPLASDEDEQPDSSTDQPRQGSSQHRTPPRRQEGAPQDAPSRRASADQISEPPKREDPFTAKRDLVPTFSINIVRTPEHYKSSFSRSSSRNSQASRPPISSIDFQQLATGMENLNTTDLSPSMRRHSAPDTTKSPSPLESHQAPSLSGVQNLVEEPTATTTLLSPLLLTTPKPSSRGLGRYSTFPLANGPTSLDMIPESSLAATSEHPHNINAPNSRNPARGKTDPIDPYRHHRHHHHSPIRSATGNGSPYYNPSPPRSSRSPDSSRVNSQHASPTTSHDHQTTPPTSCSFKHSNTPPQHPMEHPSVPLSMGIASAPVQQKKPVRKGYWNKRGDHLTMEGYIVYALHGHTYPPELQDYPDAEVGYRDEKGQMAHFLQRPEHPESHHRHNQPPLRPYSSFIEYV